MGTFLGLGDHGRVAIGNRPGIRHNFSECSNASNLPSFRCPVKKLALRTRLNPVTYAYLASLRPATAWRSVQDFVANVKAPSQPPEKIAPPFGGALRKTGDFSNRLKLSLFSPKAPA